MTAPLTIRDPGVNVRVGERDCHSCGGEGAHHLGHRRFGCLGCNQTGKILCVICEQPATIEHRYMQLGVPCVDHLCDDELVHKSYADAPFVDAEVEE